MSTPNNDKESPPEMAAEEAAIEKENDPAAVSTQSEVTTNTITNTDEFAFTGNVNGGEDEDVDEGRQNSVDCLFGGPNVCPIDPNLVDGATKSIQGALAEHVVPRVEGATKSIRGTLEEHVVPKVDDAAKSIQGALEEHVVPKIDVARHYSIRTMESFKGETQRLFGDVQKTSQRSIEGVNKHSQDLLDCSKSAVDSVSAQTMAIVNEKVKPGYQNFIEASQEAILSMREQCQTYAPCYTGTAPGWVSLTSITGISVTPWYWVLEEASLRAFGRVVFCDNPLTGIFILLGILYASPPAACCAMLSVLTVNAAAIYFDMEEEALRSGQYARNAVLIGTSVVNSFGFNFPASGNLDSGLPILLFLSVALAPATLLVESIWIQKVPNRIPSLLLPFNIVLLITLFCAKVWNHAMETQIEFKNPNFGMTVEEIELASSSKFLVYEAVLNGLSRIFFVDGNLFTGILILIGVLFCSRIVAATLLAGTLVSSFALGYIVFEENHWYLNSGYAGFNPALCAAGVFFYLVPSWKLTGLAVFGIVATLIAQCAVDIVLWNLGTPVSTSLGFCLIVLPLLSMDLASIFGNREDYFIRAVPKSELSTPEEYLTRTGSLPSDNPTDSSSSDEDDDVEKNVFDEEDPEKSPTNEETPLLS